MALPSIEAPRVAKELMTIFSRLGIPEQILTDQGTNFMSATLEEIYQLLQVKIIRTSPYYPQTDGLVERFNATLKLMLKKFVGRKGKDWDEYLPYLLFAYREVPQESTGFSPFELLFGRRVRGPLDILNEAWTAQEGERTPAVVHMIEMRERLQEMSDVVKVAAESAQKRQKGYYDHHARKRVLSPGDKVLVLLPSLANKLKLEWVGPYQVLRRLNDVNYEVETPGRRKEKVVHINLLKKWHEPQVNLLAVTEPKAEQTEEDNVN